MNRSHSARVIAGILAMGAGGALVLAGGVAASAVTALPVYPSDLGSVNFSSSSTSFDAYTTEYTALPEAGSKWVLDLENKTQGTYAQTPLGLQIDGVDSSAAPAKVRFLYYLGSGGYPAIDGAADTTVAGLLNSLSWVVKYPIGENGTDTGMGVAGVDFQAQALVGSQYHRVSGFVQCTVTSSHGAQMEFTAQNLRDCRWAVNSRMIGGTYTPGQYPFDGASGRGTTSDFLTAFGGYDVVAFGPNVGRFAPLSATVVLQSLSAFDVQFSFVEEEKAPSAPPATEQALVEALEQQQVTPEKIADPIDPATPFSLTAPWTGVDGWVDVYAYSTPVHLGVAPVVFGSVSFADLDLSGLASGTHTLVLIGQSSGAISAYSIEVGTQAAALPPTGSAWDGSTVIAGFVLLIAGGGILVLGMRRRRLSARP